MSLRANINGEWDEPMMVTVNGVPYATQLYKGVQRFVPEPAIERLVELMTGNSGPGTRSGVNYSSIPPELLEALPADPVVAVILEGSKQHPYSLNELSDDFYNGKFTPDELIDFETKHGWSVDGFYFSVGQQLENAGLGGYRREDGTPVIPELDDDGDYYWDSTGVLDLVNPLWEEE